ncbi:unnamed protein product [Closterium sp. Naga37s-1]|nr:unnamed protein product [Closterium sp. Naga37s-1]
MGGEPFVGFTFDRLPLHSAPPPLPPFSRSLPSRPSPPFPLVLFRYRALYMNYVPLTSLPSFAAPLVHRRIIPLPSPYPHVPHVPPFPPTPPSLPLLPLSPPPSPSSLPPRPPPSPARSASAPGPPGQLWHSLSLAPAHFRQAALCNTIAAAVMHPLRNSFPCHLNTDLQANRGIRSASRLLISGSSAGGQAVVHLCDTIAAAVPSANARCVVDSGFFVGEHVEREE